MEPIWEISHGSSLSLPWPDGTFQLCATSPPYWNLRKYSGDEQTQYWPEVTYTPMAGLPPITIPSMSSALGNEETVEAYTGHLILIFREVNRVLRDDGCFVLNLGDSYSSGGRKTRDPGSGKHKEIVPEAMGQDGRAETPDGLKPKDMIGVPWRVAFALQADGWFLRSAPGWIKRSAMPSSLSDRPHTATESFFLFSKNSRYYYDSEAVKLPLAESSKSRLAQDVASQAGSVRANGGAKTNGPMRAVGDSSGRNRRDTDWWFDSLRHWLDAGGLVTDEEGMPLGVDVVNSGYKGTHFACWPKKLVEPWVKACTSEKGCCPSCGAPYLRIVEKERKATRPGTNSKLTTAFVQPETPYRDHAGIVFGNRDPERHVTTTKTIGWKPGCECNAGDPVPCRVLDPFNGAATTALAALDLGRSYSGREVSAEYIAQSEIRIREHLAKPKPKVKAKPADKEFDPHQMPLFAEAA